MINTLTGNLGINCNAPSSDSSGSSSCTFQQDLLDNLFGKSGLPLSDCQFGECVRQAVIDYTSGNTTSSTGDNGNSSLSGGVIAGIAVVGALLLAALVLLLIGWLLQRKARRAGNKFVDGEDAEPKGGPLIGLRWDNVSLHVPTGSNSWASFFDTKKRGSPSTAPSAGPSPNDKPGFKTILAGVSGSISVGNMLAILGPSGAGKTSLVDILSGQDKRGIIGGQVSFFVPGGGDDTDPIQRKPRIGYVDQVRSFIMYIHMFESNTHA